MDLKVEGVGWGWRLTFSMILNLLRVEDLKVGVGGQIWVWGGGGGCDGCVVL